MGQYASWSYDPQREIRVREVVHWAASQVITILSHHSEDDKSFHLGTIPCHVNILRHNANPQFPTITLTAQY
jgi:hypothetical protein